MISFCIGIAIFSFIPLFYYYHHNKNRQIERYYFKEHKLLFALLTFINFLLIISIVLNLKFIIFKFGGIFINKLKAKYLH
jgi:hypothetical protein